MSTNTTPDSKPVAKRRHPGGGRRRAASTPKGRQVDPEALAEVRRLLGNRALQRDELIEYLHVLQDHFHCLPDTHLAALAFEMRLPMAEVFEVATFYAHFDVVKSDARPPEITVRVCDSLSCELAGAEQLIQQLGATQMSDIRIVRAPCMGRCAQAPVAEVQHKHVDNASVASISKCIEARDFSPQIPQYCDYEDYIAQGGYKQLRDCIEGKLEPEQLIEKVSDSGLRGLGGAGFPTGRKWSLVRAHSGPRLMAVNADEGEPGTFKDRHYLESDPHRFIEGMLIAAFAVQAHTIYLYLRDEYPAVREILLRELERVAGEGLSAHTRVELRRGAGAYICGEESAMIESIEGKRGLPRHRPPYVAEVGIFGRPTLVQNVETLFWLRDILERGGEWFASQGRNGGQGLRSYSVSGRVKNPGVKLAPAGISLRELIDEFAGGMLEGHELKAYLPGGASGGILPASLADQPLEFGKLEHLGCFVGSHAVVVLSQHDNIGAAALNLMRFFADESCGQCTPCRVGTEKAVALMQQPRWNVALLEELGEVMSDASICGLGQAAANPLRCAIEHFPEDLK